MVIFHNDDGKIRYIVNLELTVIYHNGIENPIIADYLCQMDISHLYLNKDIGTKWLGLYTRDFDKTDKQLRSGNSTNWWKICANGLTFSNSFDNGKYHHDDCKFCCDENITLCWLQTWSSLRWPIDHVTKFHDLNTITVMVFI